MTTTASIPPAQIEAAIHKLFQQSESPLSAEQIHQLVRASTGDEVTFAEIRRSVWKMIRQGELDVASDWKITPNAR